MKKILIVLMAFMLIGCQIQSQSQETSENETQQTTKDTNTQVNSDAKILVAYFTRVGNTDFPTGTDASSSASLIVENDKLIGNTEYLADIIVEQTKGDKFLIQTKYKYSADYDELVDEQQDERSKNERLELVSHVDNFDDYDVIYLGYPNWWSGMPMPVYSFLEEYDFHGKTIIPFNTSGGSGFSDSIEEIKTLCPNATVLEGYTTSGSHVQDAHDEIVEWIKSMTQ